MTTTTLRLKNNIPRIMDLWAERSLVEIRAAHHQETLALKNSLPEYLAQLSVALSETVNRTEARKKFDKDESTRVGKKHGRERAGSFNYTMDQMIMEYHILRQVVFDVLEEDGPLSGVEREVIICSVEQAVNDAATQFSETHRTLQEELSHTLAHDLRTPITVAKTCAEMMIRKPEGTKTDEMLRRIVSSMNRLDRMIESILDSGRIDSGEGVKDLELKSCDAHEILSNLCSEMNIVYHDRIKLNSTSPCIGLWNEDGLQRMIENLLSNANKYGDDSKDITVSVIQDELAATLSVHNEGKLIPHSDQEMIFGHFKRSDSDRKSDGWGIGLSMVKKMVTAHHGNILVQSEDGKGTTFLINLPKNPPKNSR